MTILSRFTMVVSTVCTVLAVAGTARAQKDPKFEYGKAEEVQAVEWKAQAKGGMLFSGGNAQSMSGSLGATVSRKAGSNKLALDGLFAYGTNSVQTPVYGDASNPALITAIGRHSVTSTNMWNLKARWDRFFTPNNTAFASGLVGGDYIAGKRLVGGAQVGYSRQVIKSERHLVVAEAGYDLSHESYVQQPGKTIDPVTIHSGRLFLGETAKLLDQTSANASVEVLVNLNHEDALNASTGKKGVDALHDTRINAKAGLTTTVWRNIGFGFSYGLRYDQNPAPRPLPSGALAGSTYGNWTPFARKLDTLAEASLIFTFL